MIVKNNTDSTGTSSGCRENYRASTMTKTVSSLNSPW